MACWRIHACLLLAVAINMARGQADVSGITADGNGWKLVMRQRVAPRPGGRMWPSNTLDINADDESAAIYSIMNEIDNFKMNDTYIFKLVYPDMCTQPRNDDQRNNCNLNNNINYIVWAQTTNPLTNEGVAGYQAVNVTYTGDSSRRWGGLHRDPRNCALMEGIIDHVNWNFAVGQRCGWTNGLIPGMLGTNGFAYGSREMELFIWTNVASNCQIGQYNQLIGGQYQCISLTSCNAGSTFESSPPTNTTDRVCSPVNECDYQFQYEISPPTIFSDRECGGLTECDAFSYSVAEPTRTSDRACLQRTICADNEYEVSPGDALTDRECGRCTPVTEALRADRSGCDPANTCPPGYHAIAGSLDALQTSCIEISQCYGPQQMVGAAATPTTDTICVAPCFNGLEMSNGSSCQDTCTACNANEALQQACTSSSTRTCRAINNQGSSGTTPSISAEGRDVVISSGSTGVTKVNGPLMLNDVDVGSWLMALQQEIQVLRSALISKDQAARQKQIELEQRIQTLELKTARAAY